MTNLELARYLLDGMNERAEACRDSGLPVHIPTEVNELRRILVYLIEHAEGSERAD